MPSHVLLATHLRLVANWCDAEYRMLSMVQPMIAHGYGAHVLEGRLTQLARLASDLRTWASSGKPPAHQKVPDHVRAQYEKKVCEEGDI